MEELRLDELVRKGIVSLGDFVLYPLKQNVCKFTRGQTGVTNPEEQSFKTETDTKMRLARLADGSLILVAKDATKSKLRLQGWVGYSAGINTVDNMCKALYFNNELASDVRNITEDIFNQLKECNILSTTMECWLADQYEECRTINLHRYNRLYGKGVAVYNGMKLIKDNMVRYINLHSKEPVAYNTIREDNVYSLGVLPIAVLKKELIVVGGNGSEEQPWVLEAIIEK